MVLQRYMKPFSMLVLFLVCTGVPASADTRFEAWVQAFKTEARSQGIDATLLDRVFQGMMPLPKVLQLDRHQPESTITFAQYRTRTVTRERIRKGRALLAQHRTLLQTISQQYGVPPRFLVALWGIETDYGRYTGEFHVVDALASLAYDGRRSAYFRQELLDALAILQDGAIPLSMMKGSWAGAMGHVQFMPSSFRRFAVDYDKDGRKDLWTTPADIFASAANYLAQSGWQKGERWGRPAVLPSGFNVSQATLTIKKPLHEWHRLGVRRANGTRLPRAAMDGSIVLPGGRKGPAYLVYTNFRVTMKWNRSQYFATSVGLLADAIGS